MALPWWQTALFYQVYIRSFADSDGDGVGDLRGVIERLGYLQALGIDVLWLSPVSPSPDKDFGYDVADYTSVQPAFGTLDDLDELIQRCGASGMRVVLDLVPNHTSDRHAWFQDARTSRDARYRSYYIWADPTEEGAPPNNWRSTFGRESAWQLTPETGQMYLHSFLPEQVDLDWWNEDVRREFDDVMRFWLDRGIAGFRLDVAHAIVKDRQLRDADDDVLVRVDLDETYAVQRRWRTLTDTYEDEARVLLGETWETDLAKLAKFYGSGSDQLHLAFNFAFTFSPLEAAALRDVVARTHAVLPPDAWPVWMLSNHDIERMSTRMCGGDERKIRCALLALLTLRGTAVLYQGDEIGLEQVEIPPERIRDIAGRDGCRTPMPWTRDGGGWREPWLPVGDTTRNVEDQREDASSIFNFVRKVIALRRARSDLRDGDYEAIDAPPGVWAYRRGEATIVALNLSDDAVEFDGRMLEAWSGTVSDSNGEPLI